MSLPFLWFCRQRYIKRLCLTAAATKETNSGAGANGLDFSSGWN